MRRRKLSIAERVVRGAELLDAILPDWWSKVNADRLHMFYPERCLLSQLFGDYTSGLLALGVEHEDAVDFGFDLIYAEHLEECKWISLGEEWLLASVERARTHGHYQASEE